MIKINLLPVEKRRAERTPLPRFMLTVVTAAAAAIVVAYVALQYLRVKGKETDIEEARHKLKLLEPDVKKHGELTQTRDRLKAKIEQIRQVTERKVEFFRAADAVWDVVENNKKVWLDDIVLLDSAQAQNRFRRLDPATKAFPDFMLELRCHAAGVTARDLTKFRMELKRNPVLNRTFENVNFNPEWKVENEDQFQVKYSMNFSVLLYPKVKQPPAPVKTAPAAPPKPAN